MQAWGSFILDRRFADQVLLPGFVEGHCHLKEGSIWEQPCILLAFQAFHGTHGAAAGAAHVQALLPTSTDRLRFGLVKMMLDGSIQGYSARLRWPHYINGALNGQRNGIWVTAPAQYEADFEVYHRAGFTTHTHTRTHTNGDEASLVATDAVQRVLARAPRPGHRHTLQHGQMIDRPMFERMAALGLAANLFANHLSYWGDQHHDMTMGPDRAHRLDDCRAALDAGVRLAIHSDAPVSPLAPLVTAWCAANRVTPSGRVLGPSQRLQVDEALQAITLGPAWTLGLEHEVGSIEVGKRADFAVLHDDPLAVQRWLQAAAGQRIAVLVNDFGAINLDAALVASTGADTIALRNGCVCCSIGDNLGAALDAVLARQPPVQAVVVEASGVGDPWRIAQYALADARLQLAGVLLLVNGAALAGQLADPLLADSITRPLAHADLVVLNKADLAGTADLAAAHAWVAADAQQPAGRYDMARLRAWLAALPAGVLRLKGWLPLADGGWVQLQYAGRHASLRRADAPAGGAAVVAIGLAGRLPDQAIAAGPAACAAPAAGV